MANYRLDQRSRYQEDYQENRQTLNQRRQPSRQRSQGNYRLDANGQPVMRPNQDRQRPRPYQEEHYNYEDARAIIGLSHTVLSQVRPGPIMNRTMRHAL